MAHVTVPAAGQLISTSAFGIPVANELNQRCVKVNGEIGEGTAGVANQWMTGSLAINAAPTLKLRAAGDTPTVRFENTTGGTILATIQASSTQVNHNVVAAGGAHRFLVNSVEYLKIDSAGATFTTMTASVKGTFGGNGEQVRLVDTSTSGSDFHDVYIGFYGAGVSLVSPGVRTGIVGYTGLSTLRLQNEVLDGDTLVSVAGAGTISLTSTTGGVTVSATTGDIGINTTAGNITLSTTTAGGNVTLHSGGGTLNFGSVSEILFTSNNVYQGKMDGPVFLWGKTATDNAATAGIELLGTGVATGQEGQIRSTIGATGSVVDTENVRLNRTGTANVTNGRWISFERSTTYSGGILERATSGIILDQAVVTAPSDYRLKDDLGPVVDGLDRVMLLRPRQVRWKGNGEPDEVFIAHQLGEVLPWLVAGDKDAVNDDGSIIPQTIRESGLLPVIVAAVQELAARVDDLEGLQ